MLYANIWMLHRTWTKCAPYEEHTWVTGDYELLKKNAKQYKREGWNVYIYREIVLENWEDEDE